MTEITVDNHVFYHLYNSCTVQNSCSFSVEIKVYIQISELRLLHVWK